MDSSVLCFISHLFVLFSGSGMGCKLGPQLRVQSEKDPDVYKAAGTGALCDSSESPEPCSKLARMGGKWAQ